MTGRACLAALLLALAPTVALGEEVVSRAEVSPVLLLPPQLGLWVELTGPLRYTVLMPWAVQFGPVLASEGPLLLRRFQGAVDAGVLFGDAPDPDILVRVGLRYRWAGNGWIRPAVGVGVTGDLRALTTAQKDEGEAPLFVSVSPEALAYFGPAVRPGSIYLALRYELRIGAPGALTAQVGLSFW